MSGEVLSWTVGEVEITRVAEIEELEFTSEHVAGGVTAEQVLGLEWMRPHFCSNSGLLKLSFHAFLVRTPRKTILIDTCFGAGHDYPHPAFSNLDDRFLDRLSALEVRPEDIDVVMCTHMHYDHVGWNTRNVDGKWTPTFPNARYLYSAKDYACLHDQAQADDPHAAHFAATILPPVRAGLVDFIDPAAGHPICDEIGLLPTPGHSPDHFSVLITSQGHHAVITGDVMHSPVQCAFPDNQPQADEDGPMASATRRRFLDRYSDQPVLILGTHFPAPTSGYIEKDGDTWRFAPTTGTKSLRMPEAVVSPF